MEAVFGMLMRRPSRESLTRAAADSLVNRSTRDPLFREVDFAASASAQGHTSCNPKELWARLPAIQASRDSDYLQVK